MAVIFGTAGDDLRNGTNNDDTIYGGVNATDTPPDAGRDTLNGRIGNDSIVGFANDDTLAGGTGNDTLDGGLDEDSILGGAGDDLLIGGGGLDRMAGGLGDDTLDGTGSDGLPDTALYRGAAAAVTIDLRITGPQNTGGAGIDTLIEIESVDGSEFGDHLIGNGAANTLYGYGGNDTIEGNGNHDWLSGGDGDDLLIGTGSKGNTLVGDAGNDTLIGNDGDSVFYGREGDDLMTGGAGNELFHMGPGNDVADGGGGSDWATYDEIGFNLIDGVVVDLALTGPQDTKNGGVDTLLNFENLSGTRANDTLSGTDGDNKIYSDDGDDEVHGRGGNDSIFDGSGHNFLSGGDGNDTIIGGDFAGEGDTLEGGNGNDVLDGKLGSDTADYRAAGTTLLTVDLNLTGPQFTGNGTDTLISIENILGSLQFDQLTGNGNDNALSGFDNNDTLQGGGGNDTLDGGTGDDGINGGEGIDIASFASALAAVNVTLTTELFQDTGSGFDALISIEGLLGSGFADTLTGNDGNNILEGGAGRDTLTGGLGDDIYVLRGGTFILPPQFAYDTIVESPDGGTDTVQVARAPNFPASYTLGDNLENATVIGEGSFTLTGNGLRNILGGNDYDNRLDGAGGTDRLVGRYGNDTYVLRDIHLVTGGGYAYDTVVESQFAGIDTVEIALVHDEISGYSLGAHIDNAVLTGTGAFDLTGNALFNQLQGNGAANRLLGLQGNDVLRGAAGNDTISGGSGADTIVGSLGRDSLSGNADADIFDFNSLNDSGATIGTADRISDFVHLTDHIDLSTIDAIDGGANNTFAFIGNNNFTAAGQVRVFASGSDTIVALNTSGTGGAEMVILLEDIAPGALTSGDFML